MNDAINQGHDPLCPTKQRQAEWCAECEFIAEIREDQRFRDMHVPPAGPKAEAVALGLLLEHEDRCLYGSGAIRDIIRPADCVHCAQIRKGNNDGTSTN